MTKAIKLWITSFAIIAAGLLAAGPALAYSQPMLIMRFGTGQSGQAAIAPGFGFKGFGIMPGSGRRYRQSSAKVVTGNTLTSDQQTIVTNASPAVVYINAYKNVPTYSTQYQINNGRMYVSQTQTGTSSQEYSSGSGFFITSDGYILTNKHVVADTGATYMVSYNGNSQIPAQVIYRDPTNDLAIVKIDGSNYPTLQLGDSSTLAVGQSVVSIGNALGQYTDYATAGSVTGLHESITVAGDSGSGSESLADVIQTNAKLYPGDSGGPLLNASGQVVGINTATETSARGGATAGFCLPINAAKTTIAQAGITL